MSTPARVVEIDMAELAVRMLEAYVGDKRPVSDAVEMLNWLSDETRARLLASATAAATYIVEECFGKAQRLQ